MAINRVRFVHTLLRARDYQERPEYERLTDWWRGGGRGVCALVGIGGAGKTAIGDRFLRRLPGAMADDPALAKDPTLQQPVGLFVFSFHHAPNPDSFFTELAAWLRGEPQGGERSASYGETLVLLAQAGSVLLTLDGLEKVQDDGARGGTFGKLLDGRLGDFVLRIAEGYLPSISVIITSRFRLIEPLVKRSPHFQPIAVEVLSATTAVALLRARGVRKGTDSDLTRLAEEHGRHALTVDLLGGFIGTFCQGDPQKLGSDGVVLPVDEPGLDPEVLALREQERRLARVSARYREALAEKDPAALALLERVCLFRLGVTAELLAAVFLGEGKDRVAGPELAALNQDQLIRKLKWLVEMRLLEAEKSTTDEVLYNLHPAVRDGFARGLDTATAQAGHAAIREGLEAQLGKRPGEKYPSDPTTLDLLEEIVYQTLAAGEPQAAWDLYWAQIGGYANLGWRLGAYERGERICRAFVAGWSPATAPLPSGLSENDQAFLVNEWGLSLMNLGRLDAATQCFKRNIQMRIQQEKWNSVSAVNQNLAEVAQLAGRLVVGCRAAEEAVKRANEIAQRCNAYASRGRAKALGGKSTKALEDFAKVLPLQHENERQTDRPLYGYRGITQALLLAQIGQTAEAEKLTKANKKVLERIWSAGHQDIPKCNLLLADIARQRHDLLAARELASQAHEWALARDAKEPLTWAALVKARIALADKDLIEAQNQVEEGLRMARECGYGIFHIDLLTTQAETYLLAGQVAEAEAAVRTAIWGKPDGSDITPPDQRGTFPVPETGLPTLLAATHPECGYAWGEGDARHLLAEALLLRAAQSGQAVEVVSLVEEAKRQLQAAVKLRRKIKDPKAKLSAARLAEVKKGVLTHYPLRPTASASAGVPAREEPQPMPAASPARTQVFISYSHQDREWLDRLQTMLKPLVRSRTISVWSDKVIQPGQKWKQEIENALAAAKVAVLLVSDHFLASDFIIENELPPLLAAAEAEGVEILWVYLSSCLYDETPIKDYQAAHDIARPLEELADPEQQRILRDVCREIKKKAVTA